MTAPDFALDALQRWMFGAVTVPRRVARASIDEILLPGPVLDASACLAIYRRSYVLRLRKCLAGQFPALRHALGDAVFDGFADAYLRDCPSDSYTLDALGRRFPGWLEATRIDRDRPPEAREDWIDFMVDLAHYERELFVLYDAPGVEEGLPAGLRWPTPDADDAALTLRPHLVLARYRHNVAWYYHEVRAARAPGFPPVAPSWAILLRRDYRTVTHPIDEAQFRFLEAVRARGNVRAALAAVAERTGRSLAAVTRAWTGEIRGPWIAAGFFVAAAPSAL